MKSNWKVSLIVATYNNAEQLKITLSSIYSQDYTNIECIIIDGMSTDHTINVIKQYAEIFGDKLQYVSEKDNGIYDAINKGIRMCTGDIIGVQYDYYAGKDSIRKMVEVMERENTDGVHSDLLFMNGDKIARSWKMGQGTINQGWMAAHPTLYLRKEVYDKYGLYKTDYKCAADYEFELRIFSQGVKISYIPEVLVKMFYGGESTGGFRAYWVSLCESHRALKENHIPNPYLIDLKRIIRVLLQFVRK